MKAGIKESTKLMLRHQSTQDNVTTTKTKTKIKIKNNHTIQIQTQTKQRHKNYTNGGKGSKSTTQSTYVDTAQRTNTMWWYWHQVGS